MIRALIHAALRARFGIAILVVLVLLGGALALRDAPLDVLPEFVPPEITVETEAGGFDPGQVEQLVTRPLEAVINAAPGLATMRSESIAGLSVITLGFVDGSDAYRVRQGVAERVAGALAQLPPGVGAPQLSPLTSATMDVLKIGIVSEQTDPMALRSYADGMLKPALLGVAGVARATVFGGEVREVRVDLDPERLLASNISVADVATALQRALAPHGGGFVETRAQRLDVRVPLLATRDLLGAIPLGVRGSRSLTLADVARTGDAPAPAFGDALIDGRPGVLVTLADQFGANTLAVTASLEARLAELRPGMDALGIRLFPALHRPATFVETALSNLGSALLLGAVFVAIVLLVFLRDWRAALVSFVAIPLSLLAAAVLLWKLGYSINTMTLGGFAVALGVLVDDAIIDVENIVRRLHEGSAEPTLEQRLAIVLDASIEVRGAMVYATIVVLLVFVPALVQPGVSGRFIAPLAAAFALSVLASLLVALTVTPALAALLLSPSRARADARWLGHLRNLQARSMAVLGRHSRSALLVVFGAFALAAILAARLPAEFVPAFREGHFVAQIDLRQPGIALGAMRSLGERISARIKALPFVATVEEQIGRSELGEDTWTVDRAEFHIELKPDAHVDEIAAQQQLRDVFDAFPGLQSEVLTFIGDRLSETLSGDNSTVSVQFSGADLDALDAAAAAVQAAIAHIAGIIDLHSAADVAAPGLTLDLDSAAIAATGVDPSAPAALLGAATQGIAVGSLYDRDRAIAVALHLDLGAAALTTVLPAQLLATGSGGFVRFADVAHLAIDGARAQIHHDGAKRTTSVAFNVDGRAIDAVLADVRSAVANAHLPAGVDVAFAGIGSEQAAAAQRLLLTTLATLVVIALVLAAAFRWRRHAALVVLNLPFALVGGLAALLLSRQPLSLGAAVGLVTVFGISARNAILLLAHCEQLEDEQGRPLDCELVRRAASERLRPVLMTALVSALGMLPLALGLGRAGYEIEAPLAIVVLGGLLSSTLLSLTLLPALASRWAQRSRREARVDVSV